MDGIKFKRIERVGAQSAYEVFKDGVPIGFVWSTRVLSYRGTQGWNRGIRVRDFHPLEWRYSKQNNLFDRDSSYARTRRSAVRGLTATTHASAPHTVPAES